MARKSKSFATKVRSVARSSAQSHKIRLIAAVLASSTLPFFSLAALADGTAGGTPIRNQATATYTDPNNPNVPITTVSNTVEIQVAEVAGITVTPAGIEDPNAGTIQTGDTVNFRYTITNVGNDPTQFFIPELAGSIIGATSAGPVQVIAVNGVNITPISITAGSGGANTTTLGLSNSGVFAPGDTLTVQVPVTVTANTSGAPIRVVFGNTTPVAGSTQNQDYVASGPANTATDRDVYTVDNGNTGAPEVNGAPINGQREASAQQETFLSASPKAFATVLKTSSFAQGTGPASPDGTITYSLGLQVANTSPDPAFTAADLLGTTLKINGPTADDSNRILISDVIPTGSTLASSSITPPANWTVVYSISDPTTTTALDAEWTTTAPADLTTVKRVGFVYNASPVANGGNGPLARGSNLTGFQFSVTTALGATGGTIANIAQVFGQTAIDPDNDPTTEDSLVYDESGDAQPDNYNADNSPGPFSNVKPSEFNANNPGAGQVNNANDYRGIADPATQGVDNANTNTGQGPGGEDNVVPVQPAATILNGPENQPAAVGPTDNNDDFTNKSAEIVANPAAVTFINTVNNPSSSTTLTNILLRPLNLTDFTLLPNGTTVTIRLGNNTGVYTYNSANGQFSLTSGSPISIPTLGPNVSLNYQTEIDLGNGTPLSTDINRGFPVQIVSFIDSNLNGAYDAGSDVGNITIDRLYTGFLKLVKAARILQPNGDPVAGAAGTFTTDGSVLNAAAAPGRIIEYQIQYKNISEPSTGTGNVVLNAANVTITEDGNAAPNTWFNTPTSPTRDSVFPNNPNGSASATAGTLSVTVTNNDVEIYVNNAGTIVPSGPVTPFAQGTTSIMTNPSGTFTFRRIIN